MNRKQTNKNGFDRFLENNALSTASKNDLEAELRKRNAFETFPLDVFHPNIKPFLGLITQHGDIPRAYLGLTYISALSTAIGTAYVVESAGDHIPLSVWGVIVGISSAGKSYCLKNIYKPLKKIQNRFDKEWENETESLSNEQIAKYPLRTVIFRDTHLPTLMRSVLPDNPKGIVKEVDELMEFINGMNQLSKKESTDEQIWLTSWNGIPYSGIRSGKQKFYIPRPFINIIGGTQLSKLPKMLGQDRDSSGMGYRFLYAVPEVHKIADVDLSFNMPDEYSLIHQKAIDRLYNELSVTNNDQPPKICLLNPEAIQFFNKWSREKQYEINRIPEHSEKEVRSGIFGKIKEYTLRIAAILHLSDRALNNETFSDREYLDLEVIIRAIKVSDFFYKSAIYVFDQVCNKQTAPFEVIISAKYLDQGKTQTDIAEFLYGDRSDKNRMRVARNIKKWIKEYPRVFNAIPK